MTHNEDHGPLPFVANIEEATLGNENYRTTLWTGQHFQITLMSIEPGHDIGLEVHDTTDQFLRIEEGAATVYLGDSKTSLKSWPANNDDAIVVPAGTWHNLVNTGKTPLKIYSIYSPPQHQHGTIHATKEQADKEEAS